MSIYNISIYNILRAILFFRFNKKENYNKKLTSLPSFDSYLPDSMKPPERNKFLEWYLKNEDTPFYLPEKLKEYCSNDSEILLEALIEMRNILLKITDGQDVLEHSATIAGISMNIFKLLFLPRNVMALVPEGRLSTKSNPNFLLQVVMKEMIGQV
jgi:hypothetical protein